MMVKFNSPIKKHCLIVEGQRDKEFFLKYFSLQRGGNHDLKVEKLEDIEKELNVKTENLKGIDKLKTLFTEKTDELEKYQSIIVIADADIDYATRCAEIVAIFKENGFNVQQANQIFCCPLKQKAVGVFILGEAGENPRFNDLESLLDTIRTHTDACYEQPLQAFDTFTETATEKPNKPAKSRLNIYTAYMPTFTDNQLGEALRAGYFSIQDEKNSLNIIFKELINHLSKNQNTNNTESH